MNAETFKGVMKQVSRFSLRQRELLRKRLDELDGQQEGLAVIEAQEGVAAELGQNRTVRIDLSGLSLGCR